MRLLVLRVSIPVLMLMTFHTGSCGILGNLVELGDRMSSMTPQQRIEAFHNFKAEVEGRPVAQPAPAPQPVAAPAQQAPVQSQSAAAQVQEPVAQSVSAQPAPQQPVSVEESPEPASMAAPEVQDSDNEENRSLTGSILDFFRGKSDRSKNASQADLAAEQSVDESDSDDVEGVLEELEANAETLIQSIEGDEGSKVVQKISDENERSELLSRVPGSIRNLLGLSSHEGSVVDEESSQSDMSGDEEGENSNKE